jgi:hypothetical protein
MPTDWSAQEDDGPLAGWPEGDLAKAGSGDESSAKAFFAVLLFGTAVVLVYSGLSRQKTVTEEDCYWTDVCPSSHQYCPRQICSEDSWRVSDVDAGKVLLGIAAAVGGIMAVVTESSSVPSAKQDAERGEDPEDD